MAISKVAGYLLAGVVTVGTLGTIAIQNSDNIYDGVTDFKEKIETLWDNQNVLEGIIGDKNDKIKSIVADANAKLQAKLSQISDLKGQISDKDSKISDLQTRLEAEGGDKAELQAQLSEAKNDKERLEQELSALSQYVDKVESELAQKGITDETVKPVDASKYDLSSEETTIADGENSDQTNVPKETTTDDSSNTDDNTGGEELTLADQIDKYLTNDENFSKLDAYSVKLVENDPVRIEVSIINDTPDANGQYHAVIKYIVDDSASINPSAITSMNSPSLDDYIGKQAEDVSRQFKIVVDNVRFKNEAGNTYAYRSAMQGFKTTNYNK